MTVFILFSLVILVALSAFFSATETGFLSITNLTLRQMKKERAKNYKIIVKLKHSTNKLLTTILIGNNIANNLASSLATALAITFFGTSGTGIATIIMTLVIIIFGEITPKTIASYQPIQTVQKFAPIIYVVQQLFLPLVWIFSLASKTITKLADAIWKNDSPLVTEEELKTLIDVGTQEGTLESGEKEMLHKIFEFTDLRVRDIMKNRTLIRALSADLSYEQVRSAFAKWGYSRLPVYEENLDHICGLVHYKDVLFYSDNHEKFSLKKIMRKPLFVPSTKSLISLLQSFRAEQQNLAIAVDEHGSICGIITMDDLLNAVFGRMTDEYAPEEKRVEDRIKVLSQNEFKLPGNIALSDINDIFKLNLESDYYTTIAGWVLEQFGHLPTAGESLLNQGVLYTVEEQNQRRIHSIKITLSAYKPLKTS